MTNTVLVTGAAGLLGTSICRALCDNYQMVGLDVSKPKEPLAEVVYVQMDVTSDESVDDALASVRQQFGDHIASVIHLAAYYDFSGEPSDLYEQVTVQGTRRMISKLQEFKVEQFVFSSTMLVHRPADPPTHISENDPLGADWDYPQSKIDAENVIHEHRGNIPAVLLRIAGVYSDTCDSIPIAQQIRRIAENRITSHVYPGDTSHGQSFVHLDDVTDAVRLVVEKRHDLSAEEPLLIGEPVTYSYDEIQRVLGRLIHGDEDWTTKTIPKVMAKTGATLRDTFDTDGDGNFIKPWMIDLADDHYELDVSRASQKLGWKPKHRLIDSLPEMVGALRADPAKWYERHGLGEADAEVVEVLHHG